MSEQKWQRSSLRQVETQLSNLGHSTSHSTIGRLLRVMNYSLKANVKRLAGSTHPDRNQQFEYIASQKRIFAAAGLPIISIDAKKKELIGNFKNPGQIWCQAPLAVNDHDFVHAALGKAVPYGIYDLKHNRGYIYVGNSTDTAQFAVDSLVDWWRSDGQFLYPDAHKLLILADAGGSNGCRLRLWKLQLQTQLADHLGLEVTVCHYPTGTSKWNPIEHRLFGPITTNWAGKPLHSFAFLLAAIRGTVTDTGLLVKATLVDKVYHKGIQVAKSAMHALSIEIHDTCPRWNYTIKPHPSTI